MDYLYDCRARKKNNKRCSLAIDGRTTRHAGCKVNQKVRKRIKEVFGWVKTLGGRDPIRNLV